MGQIDPAIEEILLREGGFVDNPADRGGPTAWGISKKWNPEAWTNGPPSRETAAAIYEDRYINKPGFAKIGAGNLREFLVDYGVTSGPAVAIQKLQRVLGVAADGVLGPQTLVALTKRDPNSLLNQLIDERLKSLVRLVQAKPAQLQFLYGWVTRVLSFRS